VGNVQFAATGGTLRFDAATSQLGGIISGAIPGDNFDVRFHAFAAGDKVVWQQNGPNGTLALKSSDGSVIESLNLHGFYLPSMFTAASDGQNGTLIGVQQVGHVIPPPQFPPDTFSTTLTSGQILTVNAGGKSGNVTVGPGATEIVNKGGSSDNTTINTDGINGQGVEAVTGGTVNITNINGGKVEFFGTTATGQTNLFLPGSELYAFDGSVIKSNPSEDTKIQNGTLFLDATSTVQKLEFANTSGISHAAGVAVENPASLGTVVGLSLGDFIQFGGVSDISPNMHVKSFDLNTNTITYNNNQQAHLNLSGLPSGTKFDLTQGTSHGHDISTLTVVKALLGATPGEAATIASDALAITRTELPLDQASSVADSINAGTQTEAQYVASLLSQTADTTIPAVAVEASMYNAVGSSAEITTLVTQMLPSQIDNATQLGLNPQVYACEVLGLAFAFADENGGQAFANNFGPSNPAMPATPLGDQAFAGQAAVAIFGAAETAITVVAILAWVNNWEAFYTAHGIPGVANATANQIDLAARGAAWGDAVGVALANNLGPLLGQVTSFLEDAAQGTAVYLASLANQPAPAPLKGADSATGSAGAVQLTGVPATPSDPMLAAHHL
jgi:hypothetical protein